MGLENSTSEVSAGNRREVYKANRPSILSLDEDTMKGVCVVFLQP